MTEPNADHRAADDPWHPMSDPVDIKHVGKLLEEILELQTALGRLGQALSRSLIQGLHEVEPVTGKSNSLWVREEAADVLAGIELMIDRHYTHERSQIMERRYNKMKRLRAWHEGA